MIKNFLKVVNKFQYKILFDYKINDDLKTLTNFNFNVLLFIEFFIRFKFLDVSVNIELIVRQQIEKFYKLEKYQLYDFNIKNINLVNFLIENVEE